MQISVHIMNKDQWSISCNFAQLYLASG